MITRHSNALRFVIGKGDASFTTLLTGPSVFVYMIGSAVFAAGDPEPHLRLVLALVVLSAIGANICYSFAYGLEFLFGSDDPNSNWMQFGRTFTFVVGILLGMLLAAIGGKRIAEIDYYFMVHPGASLL